MAQVKNTIGNLLRGPHLISTTKKIPNRRNRALTGSDSLNQGSESTKHDRDKDFPEYDPIPISLGASLAVVWTSAIGVLSWNAMYSEKRQNNISELMQRRKKKNYFLQGKAPKSWLFFPHGAFLWTRLLKLHGCFPKHKVFLPLKRRKQYDWANAFWGKNYEEIYHLISLPTFKINFNNELKLYLVLF